MATRSSDSRVLARARELLDAGVAASEIGKLTEAVALLQQALATLGLDERGEVVGPSPGRPSPDGPARRVGGWWPPGCCSAWRSPSTSWA